LSSYQNRSDNQFYYPCRGGRSTNGSVNGAFCVRLDAVASLAYWSIGAALIYQNRSILNPYSRHGGTSNTDYKCGAFLFLLNVYYTRIDWDLGAALGSSKSKWFKIPNTWWSIL